MLKAFLKSCCFPDYRPAPSPADVRGENSLNSLRKDGSSSDVSYSQTLVEREEENSTENNTQWERGKESKPNLCQMPLSRQYYKNISSVSNDCNAQRERGSGSDFVNKFYSTSTLPSSDGFHNTSPGLGIDIFNKCEIMFPAPVKSLDPMIETDFKYSPCSGSLGSEIATLTQFTPSSSEILVVHGYQSVEKILDCASTDRALVNSHNDVNLITEKLICSKTAPNISCENPIIPVENEYKDFRSLFRNSEEPQSRITDPLFKQLCGPDLHTSPGIEIDCSYHRV